MDLQELKSLIKNNAKIQTVNPPNTGGQSCGMMSRKVRLFSDELNLTIETDYHSSTLKSKEFLYKLLDVAIDELIK